MHFVTETWRKEIKDYLGTYIWSSWQRSHDCCS